VLKLTKLAPNLDVQPNVVEFHDEPRCQEIDSFLADRIYEFNIKATGYFDGKLLAGTIQDDAGEIIAGINGYTWGGCCEIIHVWVHEQHRGQGLGTALVRSAESEAVCRDCEQVVLMTHSFQAPGFYEHLGYKRKYAIDNRPKGYTDIVYVKKLKGEDGTCPFTSSDAQKGAHFVRS
jgi:ribosomal protein S18 acetylase RimI-like enzyme